MALPASHSAIPGHIPETPSASLSLAREPDGPQAPTPPMGVITAANNLFTALGAAAVTTAKQPASGPPAQPRGLPNWLAIAFALATGTGVGGVGVFGLSALDDGSRIEALESEVAALRSEVVAASKAAAPAEATSQRFDAIEIAMVDGDIRTVIVLQVLLDGQDQLLDAAAIPDDKRSRLPSEIEREHDEILALAGARRRFGHRAPAPGSVPP
jgi:hypothetical protein